jgi:hypothetical protein
MEELVFYVVEDAKEIYRIAWANWLLSQSQQLDGILMDIMHECQSFIAPGPNKTWDEFAETLPGFRSFWDNYPGGDFWEQQR